MPNTKYQLYGFYPLRGPATSLPPFVIRSKTHQSFGGASCLFLSIMLQSPFL